MDIRGRMTGEGIYTTWTGEGLRQDFRVGQYVTSPLVSGEIAAFEQDDETWAVLSCGQGMVARVNAMLLGA